MKQFNKVRTTLTLDPEVYEYWTKLAEKDERSLSNVVNKVLKEAMKEKEGK